MESEDSALCFIYGQNKWVKGYRNKISDGYKRVFICAKSQRKLKNPQDCKSLCMVSVTYGTSEVEIYEARGPHTCEDRKMLSEKHKVVIKRSFLTGYVRAPKRINNILKSEGLSILKSTQITNYIQRLKTKLFDPIRTYEKFQSWCAAEKEKEILIDSRHFHSLCIAVCTNEKAVDYEFVFRNLKDAVENEIGVPFVPRVLIADAAEAITNGFSAVFGDHIRVICWFHVMLNIKMKLKLVKSEPLKKLIKLDIHCIQRSQDEKSFFRACELFQEKWESTSELKDFLFFGMIIGFSLIIVGTPVLHRACLSLTMHWRGPTVVLNVTY